jgi:hypothetical protein
MPGIQSQPSVATKVGPSIASWPPFSPTPALIDCSCGMPGWGGGATRMAMVFSPDTAAKLKRPRAKAPLVPPARAPLMNTARHSSRRSAPASACLPHRAAE